MQTYGKTLFEKNGFTVVEVLEMDAAGATVVSGFAVLDSEGNELGFFDDYYDALAECERILDDLNARCGLSP